ncbi:MAG TPA: biotin carboxylase N-terminal domain-containing protein [Candidatus Limnocylindria bacterium]|nr:biotin carboxylase N-terminal domain-containing protein [Candidatus Limnocylindria bacterium]
MTTLLVANRGEIARRIVRTAKRLGMRTVAVHSDADATLPFVREADVAIHIGPAPARESYLAIDRIIAAARETRAELVHPGYGFLAERPEFASAVDAAGLRFVGPPAKVLAALGDKAVAKATAERAKVPVLPGYRGDDQSDEAFIAAARSTGYPVMIKPVAGGGGIGMQAVRDERELRDALARARRLATASFGDERLLLERLVERPRHVEIQVMANDHGNVVSYMLRDCSAQRRHQKIVEESPGPPLDGARETQIAGAARAIAREADYRNAGTMEFLIDGSGAFYFLEVNARLQVEHPVTEVVCGVDLVEQQLLLALGERGALEWTRAGDAIEARVYAEDPASGFLPSTGPLAHVRWPDDVRVDAGYEEGDTVTRHYDPLLAKVIAHGADRTAALHTLAKALDETEVLGVRTNLGFLRSLLAHPAMREGRVHTDLVEAELSELLPPARPAPDQAWAVAAASVVAAARDARDPWSASGPWRLGEGPATTVVLREGARERAVRLAGSGPYDYAGHRVAAADERHRWTVDGEPAAAASASTAVWTAWRGDTWELDTAPRERSVEQTAGAEVVAPMPGVVIAAPAQGNRGVRRGELLFVVEAMKMELRVTAPADGTVKRVLARVGQQVERGQRLAEFDALE